MRQLAMVGFKSAPVSSGTKSLPVLVRGSSKISHDSSFINSNEKTHRLLKLLFFIYKCADILLTSIYIIQWELATPTLVVT